MAISLAATCLSGSEAVNVGELNGKVFVNPAFRFDSLRSIQKNINVFLRLVGQLQCITKAVALVVVVL